MNIHFITLFNNVIFIFFLLQNYKYENKILICTHTTARQKCFVMLKFCISKSIVFVNNGVKIHIVYSCTILCLYILW